VTAVREAVALPLIFLTAVLCGALRVTATIEFVPPSVFAMALAFLVIRLIVQSGALAPAALLAESRAPLANLNGLAVLLALWAAAAQVLTVLTPESGLPRLAFGVFFLVLLLNTAAAAPGRVSMLRSFAVTFGAAFLLKFVVLHELSAPAGGRLQRVLQAMLDGVTLGALMQPVPHRATGYLAFFAVALFLLGVVLLPSRPPLRSEEIVVRGAAGVDTRGS
jgi:hypothetical protein